MDVQHISTIVLYVLRGFALTVNGERILFVWDAQLLITFLVLLVVRPVGMTSVAETLWPETIAP